MSVRRRGLVPVLLLVGALLAGCAGDDDPQERSSSGASTTSVAPDSTASPAAPSGDADDGSIDAAPFEADDQPDTAESSADARVTVSDIRISRHDGFDRVVFEFGGVGTPGWNVRYVDQASSQGSGEPVEVAGGAVLQVTLTGAGYPYDTGVEEYRGADPLQAADTEVVTEVVFDATFEGTAVAFVGTTARAPFRVHLLEDPVRVVVEVADQA